MTSLLLRKLAREGRADALISAKQRARALRFAACCWGLAGALFACFQAAASDAPVQGVLMDKKCSYKAETRIVPGPRLEGGMVVAYAHTRECALTPECQKSGYGVFTYDNKYLAFDEAGNQKALTLLKAAKKEDDLRVEVTGQIDVNNNVIKVASIKLL